MNCRKIAWALALSFCAGTILAQTNAVVEVTDGLTDVVVPSYFRALIDALGGTNGVRLGGYTALFISGTSFIKALLPIVGAKLRGQYVYLITAATALAATVGLAVGDGVITGEEMSTIVYAALAVMAAPFGYRILFSRRAQNDGAIVAAKTMFESEY